MSLWGGLASEARPSANMSECERIDERQRGILYRGPMVGAKCSYQNLEPWHARAYVVECGLELHTSAWRGAFDRRGDVQNKWLWHSSKNMSKERKTSICLIMIIWAREKGAHAYCRVLSVWVSRAEECDGTCIYISWVWLLLLVCRCCCR